MINLFNIYTSINATGVLQGATDWHCHLLPGVDDGAKTLDDSLRMLQEYEKAGVANVWLTSHVMDDMPNTPSRLQEAFEMLRDAYKGPVKLNLGAENMIDSLFTKRLEKKEIIPIGEHRDHLLVETSYFTPPFELYETLKDVASAGFFPVLAHPERYTYMDMRDYRKLKETGVKFQLNLFSLVGAYNEDSRKKARKLLRLKYYDIFGTDTHRCKQFVHYTALKGLRKSDVALIPHNSL